MTPEELRAATNCGLTVATVWAGPLTAVMDHYDIDSRVRRAAFLAQTGHESMGFTHTCELWGPTLAQSRYDARIDLGNTSPGDGFRYRGRGLIQITGRANYAECGMALQVDLIAQPHLLEEPDLAALSAGWFWDRKGLNALADAQLFSEITRRINGGQNGAADRLARYHRALDALK